MTIYRHRGFVHTPKYMISLEKSRELLGDKGKDLSNEQVREITDNLYQLVEIILDEYLTECGIDHLGYENN